MDSKVKDLESRLLKIEKSRKNSIKFFVQYLLTPITVVLIGVMVNLQIEENKKGLEELKIAQSMLDTLFSKDEFKVLATKRILDELLQNNSLKNEIETITQNYIKKQFVKSLEKGESEKAKRIFEVATTIGSDSQSESIKNIKNNLELAKKNEEEGFLALVSEDYPKALEKFKKAYEVYPKYHSVDEIYKLLRKNKDNMNDEIIKREVIRKIAYEYSWKAPKESIKKLKLKLEQLQEES